jgi:hypothetical protein
MVVLAMVNMLLCWLDFFPGCARKVPTQTREWLAIRQQTKLASSKLTDVVQKG